MYVVWQSPDYVVKNLMNKGYEYVTLQRLCSLIAHSNQSIWSHSFTLLLMTWQTKTTLMSNDCTKLDKIIYLCVYRERGSTPVCGVQDRVGESPDESPTSQEQLWAAGRAGVCMDPRYESLQQLQMQVCAQEIHTVSNHHPSISLQYSGTPLQEYLSRQTTLFSKSKTPCHKFIISVLFMVHCF